MRHRDGIISTLVVLALSLMTLTGMVFTDQFPQATQAESVGFDALAHQMFDSPAKLCADDTSTPATVQQ